MRLLTILALITIFCTSARAQSLRGDPLKYRAAQIAFIKSDRGRLIDSITIRTTRDEQPYGFSFTVDTLLLEVEILVPVDELEIETFAGQHSFGRQRCWVDPPSADVHLSVVAGKGSIDSVTLSPIEQYYRGVVKAINLQSSLAGRKLILEEAIYGGGDDLLTVRLTEAYLHMPNLDRTEIYTLWQTLKARFGPVRRHPEFQRLYRRTELWANFKPSRLKRISFRDAEGRKWQLPAPEKDLFMLDVYHAADTLSQQAHQYLQETPVIDSLLQQVPLYSISDEGSQALWQLYVRDGNFKWRHGWHLPDPKNPSLFPLDVFPGSTYLLVDNRLRIIGVYPNLQLLANAVWWHSNNR